MAGASARKTAARAATTAKAAGRTTPAKQAAGKTTATKKSGTTKTSATAGAAAKKTAAPTKKASTRKATAKKATVTKATAKTTSASRGTAAKKTTQKNAAPAAAKKLAVKSDEKPWSVKELEQVRGELSAERERLRNELNLAEEELHVLMRDAGDGAGNDQADVGSASFERDHEMSLANNARLMLTQTEHALARIDNGSYGSCESCGQAIGKMRLMAFPRATLCLSCKQREERR
jgi:RNA polymerase-binding protein DksA